MAFISFMRQSGEVWTHSSVAAPSSGAVPADIDFDGSRFLELWNTGEITWSHSNPPVAHPAPVGSAAGFGALAFMGGNRSAIGYWTAGYALSRVDMVHHTGGGTTTPRLNLGTLEWRGACYDGTVVYVVWIRASGIPNINRLSILQPNQMVPLRQTVIASDGSWVASPTFDLRGICWNGRDLWILHETGGTNYIRLYRSPEEIGGVFQVRPLTGSIDLSAQGVTGTMGGCTFDGRNVCIFWD